MLRLHSGTSHDLLIMYIARSVQLDCARRCLHAEITWISVQLVKKPWPLSRYGNVVIS